MTEEEPKVPGDEDLELDADQSDDVKGGAKALDVSKTPSPSGPIPIPYPNRGV